MPRNLRKKPHLVSVRLTDELYRRLEAACNIGPYRLSKAEIIERGLALALQEREAEKCPVSQA